MYKNYIFDLYGTLIDIRTDENSKNFFKKYTKWLRKQGFAFTWKQFYIPYVLTEARYRANADEIQIEPVFREVFALNGYELTDEQILFLCESFRRISLIYMRLFEDTISCLEGLKAAGKKIFLLSNAQRSFTWQELELTGLVPYFDGILISSDEGCMKPNPRFYDICCERYGLDKNESIMVGNELKSDMAGAKAAGIDGFYINRQPNFHEEAEPMYRYASVNGSLMEVLKQTGVDAV